MVFWYYCYTCGSRFSHVLVLTNDPSYCKKCNSKNIVRITNKNRKELGVE